jgi:hypothetical protein
MLGQSSYSASRVESLLAAIIGRRPDGIQMFVAFIVHKSHIQKDDDHQDNGRPDPASIPDPENEGHGQARDSHYKKRNAHRHHGRLRKIEQGPNAAKIFFRAKPKSHGN